MVYLPVIKTDTENATECSMSVCSYVVSNHIIQLPVPHHFFYQKFKQELQNLM